MLTARESTMFDKSMYREGRVGVVSEETKQRPFAVFIQAPPPV